jgi:hypothetical protein
MMIFETTSRKLKSKYDKNQNCINQFSQTPTHLGVGIYQPSSFKLMSFLSDTLVHFFGNPNSSSFVSSLSARQYWQTIRAKLDLKALLSWHGRLLHLIQK